MPMIGAVVAGACGGMMAMMTVLALSDHTTGGELGVYGRSNRVPLHLCAVHAHDPVWVHVIHELECTHQRAYWYHFGLFIAVVEHLTASVQIADQ